MPYVEVKKVRGKYRLVEKGTNKIARLMHTGTPRDGGAHTGRAARERQAVIVNQKIKEMGY